MDHEESDLCLKVMSGETLDSGEVQQLKCSLQQLSTALLPQTPEDSDELLTQLTLLQNVLTHGCYQEDYAVLCQELSQDLANCLVSLLEWRNKFVGYLASKCLTFCLALPQVQAIQVTTIDTLISGLLASPSDIMVQQNCLQVFIFIFSNKKLWPSEKSLREESITDLQIAALTHLGQHWDSIQQKFTMETQLLVEFTSLWLKLVKYIHKHQGANASPMAAAILDSVTAVAGDIAYSDSCPSAAVLNRRLDVISRVLPNRIDNEVMSQQQVLLARTFLQAVNDGRLERIPMEEGSWGFAGPAIAHSTQDSVEIPARIDHCGRGPVKKRKHEQLCLRPVSSSIRKVVSLVLRACALELTNQVRTAPSQSTCPLLECSLNAVWSWVCRWHEGNMGAHWAVGTLAEQDDRLVEGMLCLLDIHTTARFGKVELSKHVWSLINPHDVFLSFLAGVSHDHQVLLDLLITPETVFLLYLIKYLHYMVNAWHELCQHCQQKEARRCATNIDGKCAASPSAACTVESMEVVTTGDCSQTEMVTTGDCSQTEMVTTGDCSQTEMVTTGDCSQTEMVTTGDCSRTEIVTTGDCSRAENDPRLSQKQTNNNESSSAAGAFKVPQGIPLHSPHRAHITQSREQSCDPLSAGDTGSLTACRSAVNQAEATVANISEELNSRLQQGADLGQSLAGLLRQVSGQRLRLTEGHLVDDVESARQELRRKQSRMADLLKEAHIILQSDISKTGTELDTDQNMVDNELDGQLTRISSMKCDIPSNMAAHLKKSGSSDIAVLSSELMETVPISDINNTAWPRLTEYADTDSEDESEVDFMTARKSVEPVTMMKDWSQYMSTPTDTAALMTVVGKLKLDCPDKSLIDYPDSDSDTEESLYDRLAEAVVTKKEVDDCKAGSSWHDNKTSLHLASSNIYKSTKESEKDWPSSKTLDDAMAVLIRLRLAIERMAGKGIFPYNAQPLLKIMIQCEELYECVS